MTIKVLNSKIIKLSTYNISKNHLVFNPMSKALEILKKLPITQMINSSLKNTNNENNSEENAGLKNIETLIGKSIKIKGELHGNNNIVINGEVEGRIVVQGNLFIGDQARVNANVEANQAVVGGNVRGNIFVNERLTLKPSARIFGDIECGKLSIQEGAILNGKCSIKEGGQAKNTSEQNIVAN